MHTSAGGSSGSGTGSLAFTGFNVMRDLEIGVTMIAGGWALNRWAAHKAQAATPAPAEVPVDPTVRAAGSDDEPTV